MCCISCQNFLLLRVFHTTLPLSLPCSFIMNPLSTISQWVKQQPRPCESQGTPNMLKRRNSLTSWVVVSPRKRPFTSTSMYKPDLGRRLPNASQFRSVGKESACDVGDPSSIPGSGRSLEEGKATHSSILAWRIPWPNLRTYKNSEPTRFDGI